MSSTNDNENIEKEEKSVEENQLENQLENIDDSLYMETCSCGHNRYHHMVSADTTYTAWATFWITIMGVSATPIRVDFICRICKEKFDFEIEPEQLKNFY